MPGYKARTIKLILRKKIKDWLASIENETLRGELGDNVIVTGGAITSMLLGEKPHDFDFYLRTHSATMRAAVYYATAFNRANFLASGSARKYDVRVKLENITNIKGIAEERILFHMQSAGVASETQETYEYFEGLPQAETDEFASSLTENAYQELLDHPEEIVEKLNEELKADPKKKPYRPIFLTDNAVSLANKVQLIIRFYGAPSQIHDNFDFAHAMCYYDFKEDKLSLPSEALEAILSKTLVYEGSLYPIASLFRIRKFMNRGWRISAGQMLKIIWQVNKLKLDDTAILREQLLGVDQAYMHQLITALSKVQPHEKVDGAYVAALIDKIFDE